MNPGTLDSVLPAEYAAGARRLAEQFAADREHSMRVADHASTLLCAALPAFTRQDRNREYGMRLMLASLLHDIGRAVKVANHHRHSRYLVRHSEYTANWDSGVRRDVAALCFTHRKAAKAGWLDEHFGKDEDLLRVAALFRVADALDRGHAGGVVIAGFQRQKKGWELIVTGLQQPDAERLARRKADLFTMAFAQPLLLTTRTAP
jgi:exopolyphosphatase/guanosine-5'-triphosphate,3'-diphosphate pyrophosphatase